MIKISNSYTIAIFQADILKWPNAAIQSLLRSKYDTLLTCDQIESIIASEHYTIQQLRFKLQRGDSRIHQRVKQHAKQNNLNHSINIEVTTFDYSTISQLISIIQCFNKISHESVIAIYFTEYKTNLEVKNIVTQLSVYGYTNSNDFFERYNNIYSDERPIERIVINNSVIKIIESDIVKSHYNKSKQELIIKGKNFPTIFLIYALEMKDRASSPEIDLFINEIIERI